MLAALDRRLGDLRQRRAVAAGRRGDVADGEHLGVAGQRQVGLDDEPPAACRRRAERRGQRPRPARRSPTRSCRRRCVEPSVEVHEPPCRRRHADAEAHLDAARASSVRRARCRRRWRERRQQAVGHLDERDAAPRRPGAAGSPWPAPSCTARAARRPSRRRSARRRRRRRRAPPSATSDGSAAASSKRVSTWARSASASSRCLSGSVCSATPGMPKSWRRRRWRRRARRRRRRRRRRARRWRAARSTPATRAMRTRDVGAAAGGGRGRCRGWRRRRSRRRGRPWPPGTAAAGTCGSCWRRQRHVDGVAEQAAGRGEPAEAGADDDDVGRPSARGRADARTRCHTPTVGSPHGRRRRAPPGVRGVLRVHLRARRG